MCKNEHCPIHSLSTSNKTLHYSISIKENTSLNTIHSISIEENTTLNRVLNQICSINILTLSFFKLTSTQNRVLNQSDSNERVLLNVVGMASSHLIHILHQYHSYTVNATPKVHNFLIRLYIYT
jgi:hypothetical protein